jgi:hypothetical protein
MLGQVRTGIPIRHPGPGCRGDTEPPGAVDIAADLRDHIAIVGDGPGGQSAGGATGSASTLAEYSDSLAGEDRFER